jgi:hypothetical protein
LQRSQATAFAFFITKSARFMDKA